MPPPSTLVAPRAPVISSQTHPDSNKWYAESDAIFGWDMPQGTTGVRLLMGKIQDAVPTIQYVPAIVSKDVSDIDDGVWYFHVRLQNSEGWGKASHFRLNIDTEKPSAFDIREITPSSATNPRATFALRAKDETSGISYYEIQIDTMKPLVWRDDGTGLFETPALITGEHIFVAKAVDKAGNYLTQSAKFVIRSFESPIITDYPTEPVTDGALTIKGTVAYPEAQVNLYLQHEGDSTKSYSVKSDTNGVFTLTITRGLSSGSYSVWAEVVDAKGVKSASSKKVTIVIGSTALARFGTVAPNFLWILVLLALLILALAYLSWYWWQTFVSMRRKVRKDIHEVEYTLHKAFDVLKESMYEQVKTLEKAKTRRRLTEEEEKIIKELKENLDDVEKFVKKEMDEIDTGVKVFSLWSLLWGHTMKSRKHLTVAVSVLIVGTMSLGYWSINQFDSVADTLSAVYLANTPPAYTSSETKTEITPVSSSELFVGIATSTEIIKRVRKEINEAEQAIYKVSDSLKEAIREYINMLEKAKSKRQLTEEEEKIIKQLKKDLDDAEKFVRKEIKDI